MKVLIACELRENGNAVTDPLTMETLRNWDYQLVIEEDNDER